ncbi:hypothetical protein FOF48_10515 [Corallococcus sp. Z5C101001]|nr:hypothetical protein FOF48_10515 [Corallococcus sp. Z5C101001]
MREPGRCVPGARRRLGWEVMRKMAWPGIIQPGEKLCSDEVGSVASSLIAFAMVVGAELLRVPLHPGCMGLSPHPERRRSLIPNFASETTWSAVHGFVAGKPRMRRWLRVPSSWRSVVRVANFWKIGGSLWRCFERVWLRC